MEHSISRKFPGKIQSQLFLQQVFPQVHRTTVTSSTKTSDFNKQWLLFVSIGEVRTKMFLAARSLCTIFIFSKYTIPSATSQLLSGAENQWMKHGKRKAIHQHYSMSYSFSFNSCGIECNCK
jgi:hypothetical protein